MAGDNANFKLEIAAGLVKDYSSRWATPEQDTILDDVIEILRRCHETPRTFDVDDLAEIIADYCISQYGPPLFDFTKTEEPIQKATSDAEGTNGNALDAVQAAVDKMRPAVELAADASLPPELDIPDQH